VGTIAKRDPLAAAKGQLITSVGSIAANIAECYGRMTAPDRMRFLTYALGSAREAIAWYRTVSPTTSEELNDRLTRLSRIRRMLLGLMRRLEQGGRKFERW
jgi:four helix bundle protein